MMPSRSSFAFDSVTPASATVLIREYAVLPTTMPNTMARVSALIPLDCSQSTCARWIDAKAIAPVKASPGTSPRQRAQTLTKGDWGERTRSATEDIGLGIRWVSVGPDE